MTTRFVVESPFQLLMAAEAAAWHRIEPADRALVVLWPGEARNREQIRSLMTQFAWGIVHEVPRRRSTAHVARSRAVRRLAKSDDIGHLFIGDHESPLMRHLANRGRHRALHLLDDGLRTVVVNEQRSDGDAPDGRTPAERAARRITARALGLDVGRPGPLDFFTIFDLDTSRDDTLTRHDLAGLRSRTAETPVDDDLCLFLGGPEPELGGMSENDYIESMRHVRDTVGARIVYAPHRRESPAKLDRLERELSMTVTPARFPIEWELGDVSPMPGIVASFLSTALITIPLVVSAEVDLISFRMPDRMLIEKRRSAVARSHRTLVAQSRGRVTVRDLPQ